MSAIPCVRLLLAIALAAYAGPVGAQVLASDDFNYTGLLNGHGWFVHSGNRITPQSNGSHATLQHGADPAAVDLHLAYAPRGANDTSYATFRFRVPAGDAVDPDADGLYFTHFMNGANAALRARVGVLSPAGGGDFVLAINASGGNLGAGAQWPGDLAFDTWYTVVTSFDAATGTARLWLDPLHPNSPSISDGSGSTGDVIERFALRQASDYVGNVHIDDVLIGATALDVFPSAAPVPTVGAWAVAALALGFLGIGAVLVHRKRRGAFA